MNKKTFGIRMKNRIINVTFIKIGVGARNTKIPIVSKSTFFVKLGPFKWASGPKFGLYQYVFVILGHFELFGTIKKYLIFCDQGRYNWCNLSDHLRVKRDDISPAPSSDIANHKLEFLEYRIFIGRVQFLRFLTPIKTRYPGSGRGLYRLAKYC